MHFNNIFARVSWHNKELVCPIPLISSCKVIGSIMINTRNKKSFDSGFLLLDRGFMFLSERSELLGATELHALH